MRDEKQDRAFIPNEREVSSTSSWTTQCTKRDARFDCEIPRSARN